MTVNCCGRLLNMHAGETMRTAGVFLHPVFLHQSLRVQNVRTHLLEW